MRPQGHEDPPDPGDDEERPADALGGQGPPDLPEDTDQGHPPAAPAVAAPLGHHVPHNRQGTPTDGEQANGGRVHPCTSWRYVGPQKPAGASARSRRYTGAATAQRRPGYTCTRLRSGRRADVVGPRVARWAAKWSVSGCPLAPCLTQHYNAAYSEVVSTRGVASCACPCKIVSIRLARSTLSPPEGP